MPYTMFLVANLPPWPPPQRVVLGRFSTDGGGVRLIAYSDGHIEVAPDDDPSAGLHFAKLSPSSEPRRCIVSIVGRSEGDVDVYINGGEPLKLLSDAEDVEVEVAAPPLSANVPRSFEDPSAVSACTAWMEARKKRMALRAEAPIRADRRPRTPAEERAELIDAAAKLDLECGKARTGDRAAATGMSSVIRGLVYWPNDRPTWDPLLLRIAARHDLPLAVFAEPSGDTPEVGDAEHPVRHVRGLIVGCERPVETFRLIDLEEFLSSPFETVRVNGVDQTVSVGDAVAAVANVEHAHYDRQVPLFIDRLRSDVYLNIDLLDRVILSVGGVVSELARWVAREASEEA